MFQSDIEKEISLHGNTNLITDSGLNTGAQVFAVGDSHTIFFYNSMKIKEHWVYQSNIPLTIYRLLQEGLDIYNLGNLLGNGHEKYNIKNGDYVIFYYGFNDIQKNINIYAENRWREEIEHLFTKYIEYIVLLKQKYDITPIIPSIYPNPLPEALGQNSNGSYDERKMYVLEANKILKDCCQEHNVLYLDIYDIITDDNGFIRREYTTDFIHLDYNNSDIRKIVETLIFKLIHNHIANNN